MQVEMLSDVAACKISLSEMKSAAKRYRNLCSIKKAFCRATNTTWAEAQERFGQYARDEKLVQFTGLEFTKGIPEAFKSYCHAALLSESSSDTQPDSFKHKDATAYIVEQNCLTVSHNDIKASGIPFSGSNLFIATISEVLIVAINYALRLNTSFCLFHRM